MRTVTHREMRNNSGEILRAVAGGEDVLVTNNGRPAALITQPPNSELERLDAAGAVRRASGSWQSLPRARPASSSTAEILADIRGDR